VREKGKVFEGGDHEKALPHRETLFVSTRLGDKMNVALNAQGNKRSQPSGKEKRTVGMSKKGKGGIEGGVASR